MTEAAPILPHTTPAADLSDADLAVLHAALPLEAPEVVVFGELDAEAIALIEWGPEHPLFPAEIQPART